MADKLIDNGTLLALGLVGLVAAAGAMARRGSGNVDEYLARKMLLKALGSAASYARPRWSTVLPTRRCFMRETSWSPSTRCRVEE